MYHAEVCVCVWEEEGAHRGIRIERSEIREKCLEEEEETSARQ